MEVYIRIIFGESDCSIAWIGPYRYREITTKNRKVLLDMYRVSVLRKLKKIR